MLEGERIAVVGGGVAGIVAAYLLQRKHRVTLFEKNGYLGGHTHTIEITQGPDTGLAVDTGFIVLNDQTYPNFENFLAQLDVPTRVSEMSFGLECRQSGLIYGGSDLNGLFAQRRNLVNPRFYRFLFEIKAFCQQAQRDLAADNLSDVSLMDYLRLHGYSNYLRDNYLVPMAAAIWSTPPAEVGVFPAKSFLDFFRNHGLLSLKNRPTWKTVVGGSHSYVKRFMENFQGTLNLEAGVQSIVRNDDQIELQHHDGTRTNFDRVVVATHADQALRLLDKPSAEETRLLSPWQYQENKTVLHTDSSLLPPLEKARSAWNFRRLANGDKSPPVFVTYYMNRLQGLRSAQHYCVTLNNPDPIAPGKVIAEMTYHHPLYTFDSMATQKELPKLNGQMRSYFCGSYFGYGFHEDAVRSAVAVGETMGIKL